MVESFRPIFIFSIFFYIKIVTVYNFSINLQLPMSQIKTTSAFANLTSTVTKINFEQTAQISQSHLIAAQIMRESILKQVYLELYNKKNKQKDPNFDEYLRQIQSSGLIELPMITCATQSDKLALLGDRMGGISLYDINTKMILSKKEVSVGHRIISISAESCPVGDGSVTTIAVLARGDPNIYILRYKSAQQKLYLNYQMQVSQVEPKEGNNVSNYPYEVKLSKYGLMVAVSLYNGYVSLYSIPEPKKIQSHTDSSKKGSSSGPINPIMLINLDEPCVKLGNPEGTIVFEGINKSKTYKQMIESLKKPVGDAPVQILKDEKQKKKDLPKGKDDKKDPKIPIVQQKKQQTKQQIKQLNPSIIYPPILIEQSKDYSMSIALPKFRPMLFFLDEYICASGSKQFSSLKSAAVTTKVLITWAHTISYYIYSIRSASNNNIPIHLYSQLFNSQRPKQKDLLKLQLKQQTKTIYPITSSAVSEDLSLLALGLRDGTVQVWDINTCILRYNFDKHLSHVKCLCFFEIYKLVSGGENGEVMIHDLQKRETVVKRTNTFEPKTSYTLLKIVTNSAGIAFVLDSLSNIKIYDLWRNQKVGVLIASPPQRHTNKYRKWNIETPILLIVSDHILLLSDNLSQDQPASKKSTILQTFKIFESLLYLFDALLVIYRKGIDRQKVLNIFSNLQMNQLSQKTFELPDIDSSRPILKKQNSKGLQTISEVPASRNTSTLLKKKVMINEESLLQPEIKMFSRKRTPKMNIPNEEWLIKNIREEHCKKDLRQNKFFNLTTKTENSFHSS